MSRPLHRRTLQATNGQLMAQDDDEIVVLDTTVIFVSLSHEILLPPEFRSKYSQSHFSAPIWRNKLKKPAKSE